MLFALHAAWSRAFWGRPERILGTIANEPVDVKDLEFGQRVTIPVSEVTDWMLVQDGKLVGGYTLRVLLKRMSPQERKQTLEGAGFTVED